MVIQAEEELHGDDDEGGGLDIIARQDRTQQTVGHVERFIRHTGALHQPADPQVELIWEIKKQRHEPIMTLQFNPGLIQDHWHC